MKPNELRIGNYVEVFQEGTYQVKGISRNSIYYILEFDSEDGTFESHLDLINPILIAEEWLVKFGFEQKINFPSGILAIKDKRFVGGWLGISKSLFENWTFYKGSWIDNKVNIAEIKYIHQLQNIYFEITGEELELNT